MDMKQPISSHNPNHNHRNLMSLAFALAMALSLGGKAWAQTTYTYYCLHCNSKGYLKQYKGIVGNENNFRHNTYDDNGSSMWVYSSDGYLQQEMYYLNVINGQTLVVSTTPVTQWDLVTDDTKQRFQMHGSTKILGLDASNKPTIAESPANKYAACTLTVTENNGKWEGPKDVSWTVQSPQLVTYLHTSYVRNITVKIDQNDAGTTNVQVVNGDSRCYCSLTYDATQTAPSGMGTNWNINTTTGVIYNLTTSQQTVAATYSIAPFNPIVLADHPATNQTITIKINAKAFTPDSNKKYLLFNTQENNYRFPKESSSLSENDLLPVNGKQSDLTEAINGDISWNVEVDNEGFCSFKNVTTGRYFYYDAADYTVSNYGAVKIGSTTLPSNDTRYKFKIRNAGNRDPFGACFYIIPYDKLFADWKSDGLLAEHYFALYMNTSNSTKIASVFKASDNAKWKFYAYEWENRLWDNYSINGSNYLYETSSYDYTASTWFSRNIKTSPANAEHLMLPNSKTHNGIAYAWTLTGLDDYISTTDVLGSNGVSTLTATVNSLPPSAASGTLSVTASITPSGGSTLSNNKTIPLTLHNLNPTLTEISQLSQITVANGLYKLTADNTYSDSNKPGVTTFSGVLDGDGHIVSGIDIPLFETLAGGTVRNVNFAEVSISGSRSSSNVGTVCSEANGSSRIYNVGVLDGTVGGTAYTGGLVGLLDGEARVVNCFSYADITGGTNVGGIVGYNNVVTTANNLKTMVFNCMFYGDIDIASTTNRAPIYNGENILNKDNTGVSNYNFCRAEASYVTNQQINTANCALLAETRFLQRFEFFRHLLNGHRELAAWWVTGNPADTALIQKWVMLPDSIGTSHPYPILKPWGKYPSVVNIDAEHALENQPRNKGGKLGELTVNIQMGSGGAQFEPPTDAAITTSSLTLNITDKDPDHFNFNYYKVQLPYYNDVGTKNYTGNRVVTGWKITNIIGGTAGSFTTGDDYPAYNFADRHCTQKDLYSVSGRVFNQGAYFDVPEGVTTINIEPYWAKAAYCADDYRDIVYNQGMTTAYYSANVGGGQWFTNNSNVVINGDSQKVYSAIGNAVNELNPNSSHTVYDYAVVLVGNYHKYNGIENGNKPYTVMSIDLNGDNEPDYSFMLRFDGRTKFHPVRYDFLNLIGLGMAQKSTGGTGSYNFGIIHSKYWFEVTNTALFRVTQFEYDCSDKVEAPLIVQGGVIEQWVSGQSNGYSNNTLYFHVGGNVWFKEFHRGTHQDQTYKSKHPPISVTGGDYDEFYLTGLYRGDIASFDDNAECYINGGRFGIMAGTGQEGLGTSANKGNISWQIDNADIGEFYGGGINAAKPAIGDISTTINNSYVDMFCGGPKFGDMTSGKKVTTTATNCTFGTYFGAGYGGNSYSRQAPANQQSVINANPTWNTWIGDNYTQEYNASYGGVSTQFNYQFLPNSNNTTNVARIFIEYVKFSLATCHVVESTLTGCTVTGNFYGGGSLGKVDGTVSSTLDGCTIQGNAFGAGYSATLPNAEVDDINGFAVEPYYYTDFGTFRAGVWAPTTTYTWDHATTVNSTETAIDKINHILYTTEDPNTLGTVTEDVTLTIKGNSVIGTEGDSDTGHVYGGGDESAVTGNCEVILQGNTQVLGSVFGGGNKGLVGGASSVTIQDQ